MSPVRLATQPTGGEMKRRNMLKGLGLGIGGASVPFWCTAFGLDEEGEELCEQGSGSGPVSVAPVATAPAPREPTPATLKAGTGARPRLYLVIPKDRSVARQRGRAFGEFFNHGSEEHLARLAAFEVVCATTEEIRRLTGRPLRGEPWLVVVDRSTKRLRPVPLDDAKLSGVAAKDDGSEAVIDERIRRLGELIVRSVEPAMIERMVARESAAMGAAIREELALVLDQGLIPRRAVVEAAPATLLATIFPAKESEDDWTLEQKRANLAPRLAELTRDAMVRSQPPAGARWARSWGCGTNIEGVRTNVRVGCGMGHVPERSRRFLSFLVADQDGAM